MSEVMGFDEQFYLEAKLVSLQNDPNFASITTTEKLKEVMLENGMSPELHYKNYGSAENINISAYFNKIEYLESKLLSLRENPETAMEWKNKSIAELENVMLQSGMSPAEHYTKYGFAETRADGTLLNPSNAFDANAYFSAKLLELQKTNPDAYNTTTVAEVVGLFQQSNIDPVSHYMQYGASESRLSGVHMVQTVPTTQRVPEDADRAAQASFVPDNPAPPSLPPSQSEATAVPSPGDIGGYNPDIVINPAPAPVPTPDIPGFPPSGGTGGDSGGTGGDSGDSGGTGGDSGGTGGDSGGTGGDSGGTGGDSGGTGGDSGGTGGDSGGTEPEPELLPNKDPIEISLANAFITPLSTANADGKHSGNNQNDTVKIVTQDGLKMVEFDGGTCNDHRWQQENDTLIIDVDTNGNAAVNDGFVRIPIKNVESVELGKGVQKIYFGDNSVHNGTVRNISFDNPEDVVLLDHKTNTYLSSITTHDEGQGTLLLKGFYNSDWFLHLNIADVVWKGSGTLKAITFDTSSFGNTLRMRAEDLNRVESITSSADFYSSSYKDTLILSGTIEDKDGLALINDSHVTGFNKLDIQSTTLTDEAKTLALKAEYDELNTGSSQWLTLDKVHTTDTNNILQVTQNIWGEEASAANTTAIQKIMYANGSEGFSTLRLLAMHDLSGLTELDVSNTDLTTLQIDYTTFASLRGKTLMGKAGQILATTDYVDTQDVFDGLSAAKGFDTLDISRGYNTKDFTLTLAKDSAVKTLRIQDGGWTYPTAPLLVTDEGTGENTVLLSGRSPLKTVGIEHVVLKSSGTLDTACFDAGSGLVDVQASNNTLRLAGNLTQATLDALEGGTMVSNLSGLDLEHATITSKFELDLTPYSGGQNVNLTQAQLQFATMKGVNSVYISAETLTIADFATFSSIDKVNTASHLYINGATQGATLDMTGYASYVHISSSNGGKQVGGLADDYLHMQAYSDYSGASSQNGGDGNDIVHYYIYESYMIPESWTPHTMTGGNGHDAFQLYYHMDSVNTLPEENNTLPGTRMEITDFKAAVAEDSAVLQTDTLNLCNVYFKVPDASNQLQNQQYTANDFIGAVNTTSAIKIDDALNMAAVEITAGKIGLFTFDNDVYVYGNNRHYAVDEGDLLIKLSGTITIDNLSVNDFIFAT